MEVKEQLVERLPPIIDIGPERQLFLDDMDRYQEVEDWDDHFPEGYRERMFGNVGAETWGQGKTVCEIYKQILVDHGAWDVTLVRNDVMTPAASLDGMFLVEGLSLVNSPEGENLARQLLANKMGLENCTKITDIKKPSGAPKSLTLI